MAIADSSTDSSSPGRSSLLVPVIDYASIARPDHWFKNVFMLFGVLLAYLYYPNLISQLSLGIVLWAVVSTCLVASSNYVLNEILDAPRDRNHPTKQFRPIPSGRVALPLAYVEWMVLGAVGAGMAYLVNLPFFIASLLLLFMGLVYNVPPIRLKEQPYLDVLSESINNPLRLALGWFVVESSFVPPMSVIIAYWMVGAFFMAAKRFAEYRTIKDKARATAYRSSFRHYDESKLLVSMFFYATSCALMWGVFVIRYKFEQILCVPLFAGFFSYYTWTTLKVDSPVQAPERLYREKGLMLYLAICVVAFVALMFVSIPALYEWFNVEPSKLPSLWTIH
jgi:4-hydroxybenzoate polyprenyltransferase